MQSFASPVSGKIVGVWTSANQAGTAMVSFTGVQTPSSGVTGTDGALIAPIAVTGVVFPANAVVDTGQLIFIDVKAAATFGFLIQ